MKDVLVTVGLLACAGSLFGNAGFYPREARLLVLAPANDDLADAIVVASLPFSHAVPADQAEDATREMNEISCGPPRGSWWYAFNPAATGKYIITAAVSGSTAANNTDDLRLGIYTGNAHPLTEVFCFDNNAGDGDGELETLFLSAGMTYYIQVTPFSQQQILDVTTSVELSPAPIWNGTQSDDWSDPGNWSTGLVPSSTNQVTIIGNTPNNPVIKDNTDAQAQFVILQEDGNLSIEKGGSLTIDGNFEDGITLDDPDSWLLVSGALAIRDATDDGIDIRSGWVRVDSTGVLDIVNANRHGLTIFATAAVTIDSGGIVTIKGKKNTLQGVSMVNPSTELTVNGTLLIDSTMNDGNGNGNGIEILAGTMMIGGTGAVELNDLGDNGIEISGTQTQTVNGELMISATVLDGISINGGAAFVIGDSGAVTIRYPAYDGVYLNADGIQFTVNGALDISETGEDGIDRQTGNLTVGENGTVDISHCSGRGLYHMLGTNHGAITIANTAEDAMNVRDGAFTNGSTGSIYISKTGKDGIDCDNQNFNNSGLVAIDSVAGLALNDRTFQNLYGGTLSVAGAIEAINCNFAPGSILEPGSSPGIVIFNHDEFFSGVIFKLEIDGAAVGTEYDQVMVMGTVDISDAILELHGAYAPSPGESFVMIDNDGSEAVTGTFTGLPEGAHLPFNGYLLAISYQGGDGNDVVLTVTSILPVELLSFIARPHQAAILLEWETASELNNEGFEIQRSTDGHSFNEIGWVGGQGTSSEKHYYTFADEAVEPNIRYYYRLRQVDLDGNYEYSDIRSAFLALSKSLEDLVVYPNPTADFLFFEWPDDGDYRIDLIDRDGKILLTTINAAQLDVRTLPAGVYFMKMTVQSSQETMTRKITVIK